jgi:hypothetical protein
VSSDVILLGVGRGGGPADKPLPLTVELASLFKPLSLPPPIPLLATVFAAVMTATSAEEEAIGSALSAFVVRIKAE